MYAYQYDDYNDRFLRLVGQEDSDIPFPATVAGWSGVAAHGVTDVWLEDKPNEPRFDRPFLHTFGEPWGIYTSTDIAALHDTITALKCKAAGPTPSWRGLSLLKRWYTRNPERWRSDPGEVPPTNDVSVNLTKPLPWSKSRRYLHAIDQRAAYLAASRRVNLGAGKLLPVKRWSPLPGIWHVSPQQTLHNFHPIPCAGWYDSATLAAAWKDGQGFDIKKGYVWATYSTALRGWSELLGNALIRLPQSKPYIKRIYTRTMGKLGSHAGGPNIWYRRPDWWRAIVAASNYRLWSLAMSCPAVYGISVDTAYIVTEDTTDLPEIVRSKLGEKPGQYRILWTKPLPPTTQRLFGKISATELDREMSRYGAI